MTCPYPYEDGEASDLWFEGHCVVRKSHRCYECFDPILPGDRCTWASSLYDGRWSRVYRCMSCSTLAELVATINEECPLWGGLDVSADAAGISFWEWRQRAKSAIE